MAGLPSTLPEQRNNTSNSSNHGQHLRVAYYALGAMLSNEGVCLFHFTHNEAETLRCLNPGYCPQNCMLLPATESSPGEGTKRGTGLSQSTEDAQSTETSPSQYETPAEPWSGETGVKGNLDRNLWTNRRGRH